MEKLGLGLATPDLDVVAVPVGGGDLVAAAAGQIAAVLADRPRANALGARAASYAALHFAPAEVAAAHLAHYERVAAPRRSPDQPAITRSA